MKGHYGVALIAFLLGVFVANRIGFLQPIAGSKS
jgi:hypothetical protein